MVKWFELHSRWVPLVKPHRRRGQVANVDWPRKELFIIHPRTFTAGFSSSQSSVSSHVLSQLFWMYSSLLPWKLKTRWEPSLTLLLLVCLLLMRFMEVIGLPFFIFWLIVELQGNTSGPYCVLISFSRASLRLLGITSLLHLAKVNAVEQYIAIKHSLCYEITVTEARLIGVSSLLWTITLLSTFSHK